VELIERDNELRLLEEHLRDATRGRGRMVLIGGEAGIGKTSLVQALADRRGEATLWWGACDALQTPHPLAPLHDIARAENVGFRALMSADTNRAELFEAVLTELQGSRRPILAVIEDVHWADDATMDLLKFLGRRIDRVACLLVVSFRDDQLTPAHPLRRLIGQLPPALTTRIDVPRLSLAAVEVLARRALQSAQGLHAVTQGNPFFVTEVLRHGGEAVPRAVRDLVLARYAELHAGAQAVVRLACVVPGRMERWLVERLLGDDVAAIEASLGSGLLGSSIDGALVFRHELARVAIESSLVEPVARSLHAAVLGALRSDTRAQASLARLVHHAVRCDDHDAVMHYAPQAADQARQRGAYREAAAHYATALRHAEIAGVDDDAERVANWLDGYAGGCERSDQLDELIAARLRLGAMHRRAGHVVSDARNLSQLAMSYTLALRNREAEAASRQALALLEPLPPSADLATAWRVQAHLCMLARDHDQSIRYSSQALELAERLGERETAALAVNTLGAATIHVDYDAGRAHLLRALDIGVADKRHFVVANALNNLAAASCELFRLSEAEEFLRQALALCERDEFERNRSYYLSMQALCDVYLGRWDAGAARALEIVGFSGAWNTSRIFALVALGRVQARRGEPDASATLDEALSLAEASQALRHIAPVRAARAEAAWLRGDTKAVVEEARAALARAASSGPFWFASELAYWLHRAGAADGVPARCVAPYALQIAGDWAAAAAAWATVGCPYEQARALAEGDGDAPLRAWRLFDAMGARPAADAVRRQLGKASRRLLPPVARLPTPGNPFQLTPREVEVLSLLCAGMKNAAIAARLVRSVRTVDHHIAAIYGKLGVSSRSEAVAAALRAGIGTTNRQFPSSV
jgi:DNA-binding CsgD family transcriptional regulator/tetratricopeptide (TPR) repeat protein